jgi:hypothetical protein
MTPQHLPAREAAARLADILAQENAALTALAFGRTADLAADKERALDDLRRAFPAGVGAAVLGDLAGELNRLLAENKLLLQRAILVQGQLIACIARAARRSQNGARAYGRTGGWAHEARPAAMALAARV